MQLRHKLAPDGAGVGQHENTPPVALPPARKRPCVERAGPQRRMVLRVQCSGEHCAQLGFMGNACIVHEHPLPDLEDVWNLSPAQRITRFEDITEPDEQRYPLYYYYATRVFRTIGQGNRFKLPACVVWSIRLKYPDSENSYVEDVPIPPSWVTYL